MYVQRNKGFHVDIIADSFPEILSAIGVAFTYVESASSGVLLMLGAIPILTRVILWCVLIVGAECAGGWCTVSELSAICVEPLY